MATSVFWRQRQDLAADRQLPRPDTEAVARGKAATRAAMVLSSLPTRGDERAGGAGESL
ncbi:DUF2514 family protein [Pseudomonas asiatica]|uniref:DUF2514 family protein n=1 Tax=Pseudomonas asiatica TaxID=2219225 RepID=UPI003B676C2F